ncbi:MAG: DUF4249 domain-containing protein [Bacteroidales bacterium]|nr:DUF4249 domain-containing protein [Bacteroidales bacterium]
MPVNRYHIILLIALVLNSCIEPYDPIINERQEVMVIDGMISDKPGVHRVTVSHSSPYNEPGFKPVSGCVISVQDNLGNMEVYSESWQEEGVYEAWLDEPFLGVGKAYSLHVVSPSNRVYASDYDTLLSSPPIDSIYYIQKVSGGEDQDDIWHGIQFYNDVRGHRGGTRNYRWKAIATWEYHSPFTATYVRYKGMNLPYLEDTVSTCYLTETIETVYAASTQLLSENNIYQNKLHYVSDQTPRLAERYSLLVEQHSLTDQAYAYWEKLAAQSANSASLYETQPSSSQGNIYNVHNSHVKVLGCFYATQIVEDRIFVEKEELDFPVGAYTCRLDTLWSNSIFTYNNYYYLFSLQPLGPGPPWLYAQKNCFDCTLRGGDNEIPDFW